MTNATVRLAAPHDFEAVAGLLADLGRPALTVETRAGVQEVYLRHLERPDTASMVAEANGAIVGFISLEFRSRLNRTAPQAWVPDLIVNEGARGTGAGKALLQAAIAEARRRGCFSLTLESGYSRAVAHQFYVMQGMQDLGKYFTIQL